MQQNPYLVQPEAGKNLHFPGGDMASIMLSGEQTDRALAVVACTQAPDSGPPLHIHKNEDELFTGRHWVITVPSGWELFMTRYAKELAKPDDPDQNRMFEIAREHGIEFIDGLESFRQPR